MTSIPVKSVPITKDTVIETPTRRILGQTLLQLPEGPALCSDALSLTVMTAEDGDTAEKFIVVIGVADFPHGAFGSLSPMTPNEARSFAASLVDAANKIDGGARG